MVARQDVQYRAPLDFRLEPYEVAPGSPPIGTRSFTLGAEIRDPGSGTVYATAGTVVVGSVPLTPEQREALSRWRDPCPSLNPMTAPPREQSQSLLLRIGEVAVEPAPVPEPGPHQVLVEVAAVGVCGSDVHYFDHGRIADFVVREPLVLGHEASGTIRAVGSEVRDRTPGSGSRWSRRRPAAGARSAWPGATTSARTSGSSPPRRSTGPSRSTSCWTRSAPIRCRTA